VKEKNEVRLPLIRNYFQITFIAVNESNEVQEKEPILYFKSITAVVQGKRK